jgi:hypothetical protein
MHRRLKLSSRHERRYVSLRINLIDRVREGVGNKQPSRLSVEAKGNRILEPRWPSFGPQFRWSPSLRNRSPELACDRDTIRNELGHKEGEKNNDASGHRNEECGAHWCVPSLLCQGKKGGTLRFQNPLGVAGQE